MLRGNRARWVKRVMLGILLVEIEAEDILTFSERCTPAVHAAVPRAVEAVLEVLAAFSEGEPT
jgi:Ni,Fe-hydrogenase maturation factor